MLLCFNFNCFLIVLLTPFITIPDFLILSTSSFEITGVVSNPKIFFWIAGTVADVDVVNLKGTKTLLGNGASTLFINGKSTLFNEARKLSSPHFYFLIFGSSFY